MTISHVQTQVDSLSIMLCICSLEAEKEAKNVAMAAALTTFLKNVGVRISGNALERCQSFTARDKRSLLPTKKSTKKVGG